MSQEGIKICKEFEGGNVFYYLFNRHALSAHYVRYCRGHCRGDVADTCSTSSKGHQDDISLICSHSVASLIFICHIKIGIIALQWQLWGKHFL